LRKSQAKEKPKKNQLNLSSINPELLEREVKKEQWRRDSTRFIEEAVYIEDRDVEGLAIPFELWEEQRDVARRMAEDRLLVILKARQLGLTWLALAFALHEIVFKTGYSVVGLSKREEDAKELTRRMVFMLRYLPKWLIREHKGRNKNWGGPTWEATTMSVTIHHPEREPAVFQSMTSGPDSGRSFTANLVILDEWAFQQWAEEIWSAAYPTINRPTGGKVFGLSTGKRGTLFEMVWRDAEKGLNKFVPIFLPWWVDPRRDRDWYEDTKRALPNTYRAEYPSTPEEAFMVGEGAFFPEWDPDLHIINEPGWYPPSYCQIIGAYDSGYGSNACFKWYAVFPDGTAIAYREYYPQHVTDSEQAKEILRLSKDPDGNPEKLGMIPADPSCWNKQPGTGKSTAEEFLSHGLRLVPGDNNIESGWRRLHEWLRPGETQDGYPALRFTINCGNTIRTYSACEQSKTNPEDISKNSEHHAQDVDRYFIMSRPRFKVKKKDVPKKKLPFELQSTPAEDASETWTGW